MTIAKKTLGLTGASFLVLFACLYGAAHLILTRSFLALETRYLTADVQRAVNTLQRDLDALDTTNRDYAVWDDTYAFIEDRNQEYVDANLIESVYTGNRLSLVVYLNTRGEVVFQQGFDLEGEALAPPPPGLADLLARHPGLARHPAEDSAVSGVALIDGRPFLVASRPILTSDEKGPVRGALVMARELTASSVRRLGETAQVALSLRPVGGGSPSADAREATAALEAGAPSVVRPRDGETVSGYALIRGLGGSPVLLAQVDAPRAIYRQGRATLMALAAALAFAAALQALVTLGILRRVVLSPLRSIAERMHDIANGEGDLTTRIRPSSDDEIGQLGRWFDLFVERIEQTVKEILAHSADLAESSERLSGTAAVLSEGARRQAGELTEAAAATTELSASIRDTAGNAEATAGEVQGANDRAAAGSRAVEQTVEGMHALAERVRALAGALSGMGRNHDEIGGVLSTIEDIADQTNLLALNAAIEAARAGSAGRGFAVVADEVRRLAERTAQATRTIGETIRKIQDDSRASVADMDASLSHVEVGLRLADEARQSLGAIVESARAGSSMVQVIVRASQEQAVATDRVAEELDGVLAIARSNDGAAEEVRAATERFAGLAADLHGAVRRFKVGG